MVGFLLLPCPPPSPISPMRLSSALSSFYSSHFPIPATTGTDTLLPSPNQPAWVLLALPPPPPPLPPVAPSAVSFIYPHLFCCILRKPRSIPYQPVRRRAFFYARGEAREHGQRCIDEGGQRIVILLLSGLAVPASASPDFRCSSSIAFLTRPTAITPRQSKWIG